MKSHEYANKLKMTAEYLLERPEFETPNDTESIYLGNYWDGKENFVQAVKSLGNGKKEFDGSEFQFTSSTPIPLWIRIARDKVCRKVQDEKWECEPLLTQEEIEAI